MDNKQFEALLLLIIPQVVAIISNEYKVDEIKASVLFYQSKTNELLEIKDTNVWHYSPLTIFNMFDSEQKKGKIDFPEET